MNRKMCSQERTYATKNMMTKSDQVTKEEKQMWANNKPEVVASLLLQVTLMSTKSVICKTDSEFFFNSYYCKTFKTKAK